MYDDLRIKHSKHMDLIINSYMTYGGEINLYNLRADVQKYSSGRRNKKKFVVNPDFKNKLSFYPREKLTSYMPPKRQNNEVAMFQEIIQDIRQFFATEHRPS